MFGRFVRLILALALCLPATPAFASPSDGPTTIVSEGFEGTASTYRTIPTDGEPAPPNGTERGFWGPVTFRKYSGLKALWVNGSRANGTQYLSDSAGWAEFDLPQLADYYDADLSFYLSLPSRGSVDGEAFGVRLRNGATLPLVDTAHPLTTSGQWRRKTYDLGEPSDPDKSLARNASAGVDFKWRDYSSAAENPKVGEGATIDDVLVIGWKYGPVRRLASAVGTSGVNLTWELPYRAVNSADVEERGITYRIWSAPGGSSTWTEVTKNRLDKATTAYLAPLPAEGVQYRYGVQAWDTGTGQGYGRSSETTVNIPLTPPTVTLTSPANKFPMSTAPVTVAGTSADIGTGVATVQVRVRRSDGYCLNALGNWVASDTWINATTANAWANWSYTWTPDEPLLASGQIVTVSARARDGAGAYSTVAQVSSNPPAAGSVSLADGAPVTTAQMVGTTVSSTGATHMRWSVNDGAYTAWIPFSSNTTVDLGAGDGTKQVKFQFSSDGGATFFSIASDSILLHTSLPAVSFTSPSTGYSLLDGAVAITGTASDVGGAVTSVVVRIRRGDGQCWNGAGWSATEQWLPVSTSDGYASWNTSWTPDEATKSLGQIVTISAKATDSYDLTRTSTGVSSSVPVAASLSLAGGSNWTTALDVDASIAATGFPTTMRHRVDAGPWSAPQPFSPETSVALPAGDVTRTVTFEVSNGETTVTASDTVLVHTSVPDIAVNGPAADFLLVGTVPIQIAASDEGGAVEDVEVRIRRADGRCWDGRYWTSGDTWLTAPSVSDGEWAYLWLIDPFDVMVGQIVTVSARATDSFGLVAESPGVASSAPVAASITLAGGAPYSSVETVPVGVSAMGATHMRYSVDGTATTDWFEYASETEVAIHAEDGEHEVTFEFTADPENNRVFAAAADSIVLDRVEPTVGFVSPAPLFSLSSPPATIQGTAADNASGVTSVRVRITRTMDAVTRYWNGFGWQDVEHWLVATGTDTWSLPWSPSPADLAGYDPVVIEAEAFDEAGNQMSEPTRIVSEDPKEPTILSARALATTIAYGATTSVAGTLTTEAGRALPTKPVRLEYYSSGWKYAKAGTTDANGAVSISVKPSSKTSYRLVFLSDADYVSKVSPTVVVTPKPYLSTPSAPSTVRRGVAFTSYGYLKPRHSAGSYPVRIYRERYVNGSWKSYGYVKARAYNYSSYTKYVGRLSLSYAGKWRIRAYAPADTYHAAAYSSYRYVTVR